jgi:hypothetical protein
MKPRSVGRLPRDMLPGRVGREPESHGRLHRATCNAIGHNGMEGSVAY